MVSRGHQNVVLNMTLPVIFIIKSITSCMIGILKQDNQLSLFRRLEQISKKQINCQCSIEFLRLCQSFNLTPTFAEVSHQAKGKWKQSSKDFSQNVIAEEICLKCQQNTRLTEEVHKIYSDIRHSYSTIRYLSTLHILTKLREKH